MSQQPDPDRYHRQMLLPGFGSEGQRRLLGSTVLILGCGALGSMAADMLARAGVGHLVIVDRDYAELTNLQRQVLYDERDVAAALPKAEAAKFRIGRINSQVMVDAVVDDVDYTNIGRYASGADLIVDGLDNFESRYLANDYAVRNGLPYLYGGAVGTSGMAFVILPRTPGGDAAWEMAASGNRSTPCLRCLFEQAPPTGEAPTCDTVGVLGPAVAMVANFQAAEALKLLTGNLDRVNPTMLSIDLWSNDLLQLKVSGSLNPDCPCCGRHDFEFLDGRAGTGATALCGRDAVQLVDRERRGGIWLEEIARRLRHYGPVVTNEFLVRARIDDAGQTFELTLFADGRAIVKGTGDPAKARSVFARYVGT
ncbi:MAG: ThiF family adenylyltransferase [Lysobacterales bacterium]